MKKPFVSLKKARDIFALAVCVALCFIALSLFWDKDQSLPAFSDGSNGKPKSLYTFVETNFN